MKGHQQPPGSMPERTNKICLMKLGMTCASSNVNYCADNALHGVPQDVSVAAAYVTTTRLLR